MQDYGTFAISGLPEDYATAVEELRTTAPKCFHEQNSKQFKMLDGSSRRTFASQSENPSTLPECVENSGGTISKTFDKINKLVTNLITQVAGEDNILWSGNSSSSSKSLFEASHKDHIHVYEQREVIGGHSDNEYLLPFHVDNGLYLLITPAPEHPLLVKDRSGQEISTSAIGADSVLVLLARGLTDWLFQGSDVASKFHAVPHAVRSLRYSPQVSSRTVYARMKVVPLDALPYRRRMKRDTRTFGDVFNDKEMNNSAHDMENNHNMHKQMSHMLPQMQGTFNTTTETYDLNTLNSQECATGTAYCWLSCLALPQQCPSVDQAMCYSKERNIYCSTSPTDPEQVHDGTCNWECKPDEPPVQDPNRYCTGALSMFMTGFEVSGKQETPCIILLFQSWILDSRLKIILACLGIVIFGIFIEFLIFLRRQLQTNAYFCKNPTYKKIIMIGMFGLNISLGYLAMLIAMTYSFELFIAMVIGLTVGYAIFNVNAPVGESADPCCVNQNDANKCNGNQTKMHCSMSTCTESERPFLTKESLSKI